MGPGSFVSGAVALVGAPIVQASHSDGGWLGDDGSPQVSLRGIRLLSPERAKHGSSPVSLRRFVLSLREGEGEEKHVDSYTLFAGLNPAIVGNAIEEMESSEETKQ